MPGNPTGKELRGCYAAKGMNELVVGMPNPRSWSLGRRADLGLGWTHGSGLAP